MRLSFFPKFFHLQPHSHLPQLNFSVYLYWKYSIAIVYMHILSKISHKFKPNQAPNVASSIHVGYIISCMFQPFYKILCSCSCTQNAKNIHTECFPGVNFTSLALDKLRTQFHLVMYTKSWLNLSGHWTAWYWHFFFQFLKSSGYMCNLCCQNDTYETQPNNPHLDNKHFRSIVC